MPILLSLSNYTISWAKWELIERVLLSKEALIILLIAAILWLVRRLEKKEKKIDELYQKQENLLIGALLNEKINNLLAKASGKKKTEKNP